MELKCNDCMMKGKIKTDKSGLKIITCHHYGMPVVMGEYEECAGYVRNEE
jgi:hypothetical protein